MEPFIDFGAFEILAATGLVTLGRKVIGYLRARFQRNSEAGADAGRPFTFM